MMVLLLAARMLSGSMDIYNLRALTLAWKSRLCLGCSFAVPFLSANYAMSLLSGESGSIEHGKTPSSRSFLSSILESLAEQSRQTDLSEQLSFASLVSMITANNDGNYRGHDSTPGLKISKQTVYFQMAVEDAARGQDIHICNTCYIGAIAKSGYDYETFTRKYREYKDQDQLIPLLLETPAVSNSGGIPSCFHAPLCPAVQERSTTVEITHFDGAIAYCLWRINESYDPDSTNLQDLKMLCFHKNLDNLKEQARKLNLTEEQKAYIEDYKPR
jgi:hypothetical protein